MKVSSKIKPKKIVYGIGNSYGGCTHNHRTLSGAKRCLKRLGNVDERGVKIYIFIRKSKKIKNK